jgi:hypothetical protein
VIAALSDNDAVVCHFVDKAMLTIDAPGPISGPIMLQKLRVTDSVERRTPDLLYQEIYTFERFPVRALPVEIIFPAMLRPA